MQTLEVQRSPLDICVEHMQQTAGPAANSDNVMSLATKLMGVESTLQSCSRIILRDMGLTLRLLRIANSAMFNHGGQTVTSVTHAAALLGTDALAQIVDTVPRTPLARPVRELVVLGHLTAVVARSLISRLEPRYAEEAFISGLFRNVGEVCYANEYPGEYKQILAGSHAQIPGLRASCRTHAKFDFDELSAGLLANWGFYGPPVLAAQSTPEALLAQQGNPEAEIALAASVAHVIVTGYFRCELAERDKVLRHAWVPLFKRWNLREPQMQDMTDFALTAVGGLLAQLELKRDDLRLKFWVPPPEAEPEPAPALVSLGNVNTVTTLLREALANGVDRAAWLRYDDPKLTLGAFVGEGWPGGGADDLPQLVQPKKPPYLLAFAQRQDVWIDFGRDDRFQESPLALALHPAAFFLLPVTQGRRVRGCLYFDWSQRRDFAPDKIIPPLAAIRDYLATNMPAA